MISAPEHSRIPFGNSCPHPVKLSGAFRLSESHLPNTEILPSCTDKTSCCRGSFFVWEIHPMSHKMSNVLTRTGRDLARIELVTPQTNRASKKSPTDRDRWYTDHTLSVCSTGIYGQKPSGRRDWGTHFQWSNTWAKSARYSQLPRVADEYLQIRYRTWTPLYRILIIMSAKHGGAKWFNIQLVTQSQWMIFG